MKMEATMQSSEFCDYRSNVFCWTFGCRITNGIELLTTTTTTSYNMLLRRKMVERGKRENAESIETYMIGVLLDFWINYHIIAARRLYKSHWEFLIKIYVMQFTHIDRSCFWRILLLITIIFLDLFRKNREYEIILSAAIKFT